MRAPHRGALRCASPQPTAAATNEFEFTSVSVGATYLLAPPIGLSADATQRVGTFERSTFLIGIVLRP